MSDNILVVDDEREIADLVELYLQNENYTVFKYYTAKQALECIDKTRLDLAVLDVMLPSESGSAGFTNIINTGLRPGVAHSGDVKNGLAICQKIREKHTYPIIMLTAKDEETDKITGLTLGADDYITKPFRPLELVARVKAQLRRYKKYNGGAATDDGGVIVHSGLVININTHEALLNEKPLQLTPTEFSILRILCENKGNVVSSEQLFHKLWGGEYFNKSNNTVTVHIRHLREKMNDTVDDPKYIKTVWGVGYKIEK
ncbi:MAG: response regulator transcription factor [Oscillospiraceae bacterium]|nr:response regulator transcription factor [Oscillospiraceae bacterium]